jgi:hypothetical protein
VESYSSLEHLQEFLVRHFVEFLAVEDILVFVAVKVASNTISIGVFDKTCKTLNDKITHLDSLARTGIPVAVVEVVVIRVAVRGVVHVATDKPLAETSPSRLLPIGQTLASQNRIHPNKRISSTDLASHNQSLDVTGTRQRKRIRGTH